MLGHITKGEATLKQHLMFAGRLVGGLHTTMCGGETTHFNAHEALYRRSENNELRTCAVTRENV